MIKECKTCQKNFDVYPFSLKRDEGKYCSRACFATARRVRVRRTCPICRKAFSVVPSALKSGRGKYCSRPCYEDSIPVRRVSADTLQRIQRLVVSHFGLQPRTLLVDRNRTFSIKHPRQIAMFLCRLTGASFLQIAEHSIVITRQSFMRSKELNLNASRIQKPPDWFTPYADRQKPRQNLGASSCENKCENRLWRQKKDVLRSALTHCRKPGRPQLPLNRLQGTRRRSRRMRFAADHEKTHRPDRVPEGPSFLLPKYGSSHDGDKKASDVGIWTVTNSLVFQNQPSVERWFQECVSCS